MPEIRFSWPETAPNVRAVSPCPCAQLKSVEDSLFAFRTCLGNGTWGTTDASSCELSDEFSNLCNSSTSLTTRDLITIASEVTTTGDLTVVVSAVSELANGTTNPTALDALVEFVDAIFRDESDELLMSAGRSTGVPSMILQLVDVIATKTPSQFKSYEKQSFKFQVQMVNTTGIGNEGMAITLDNSRVVLPPEALSPPSVVISTLSVSKVSLFGGSNSSVFPETNILSVSILGQRVANLKSKIQLVIRKTESQSSDPSPPVCSYWKSLENGGNLGEWSGDGCSFVEQNATHVTCECDHLTAFAAVKMAPITRPTTSVPPTGISREIIIIIAVCVSVGVVLLAALIIALCVCIACCRCRKKRDWSTLNIRLKSKGDDYETLNNETVLDFLSSTM
jgi:hypothetical protein